MVSLAVVVKATLDNVTDLEPTDTEVEPFEYRFEIECTSCRERHDKPVSVNRFETYEIPGSRGNASFVYKCRSCGSSHSATITKPKHGGIYDLEDSGKEKTILLIDSRGLDFVKFIPLGNFQAKGTGSSNKKAKIFKEIDLSENEWYDYDDDANQEVSIVDVEWDIIKA
ncbi:hypothetical protein PACTADRAFT_46616 [Pachysolen tannophilus NRRL Y-2460]|uniref:DUF866-domain-containing protein n=1 Tax=Pachysolen tannophilus NRRL Y-2460 TaxID=669874 RepID=A0A1E4TP33_PACTA|nr:hypothetical protein PACTADRAFT_46616 [Pachysolen tannophilus NRRL Y-2460]